MPTEIPQRLSSLRALMQRDSAPVDALLVSYLTNIGYLSGFNGSTAYLVISQSEAFIVTDGRYAAQVAAACPDYELFEAVGSGGYIEAITGLFKKCGFGSVGFESGHVTVDTLDSWKAETKDSIEWKSAPKWIEELRTVKSDSEIALMREAVRIAEGAFDRMLDQVKPGVIERDFALELEFMMRRMGADAPSFDTIVASGPNGASPHHHTGARQFEAGDLVTVDWGARKDSYCSDITRTVAVPGKPVDPQMRRIYEVVLEAKECATEACLVGANGKDVDAVARTIIADAGFGNEFKHGLGHGLGRDVHDGQTASQRASKVILKPGMVTTIEPGIYVDGLGGVRIEEDVLITETGPQILTTPAKPL